MILVALVLSNLAFVGITESARWIWLGPLLVLAAASPRLSRFARHKTVRTLWNISLLGAFALLVKHATEGGVAHMLEDGLMLAALCQVHLLNNLRREQKPDLLFFNSFLIAVVTSFLTIGVAYFAVFLVYAPLLVMAMQSQLEDRVVLSGLWRTAVVLALTLAVFALMPRDFHRIGFLRERLGQAGSRGRVDFSSQVKLDRSGDVTVSDRVVLRVRGASRDRVPAYWRGATMGSFEGNEWEPSVGAHRRGEERFLARGNGRWRRAGPPRAKPLHVTLEPHWGQRVFLPLPAVDVLLPRGVGRIFAQPDGVLRTGSHRGKIEYDVWLTDGARPVGVRADDMVLFRHVVPREAIDAAERLNRGRTSPEFVEAVRDYLSERYLYLPPGDPGGATNLSDFIRGEKPGHCEYFATAMVVMLRSQGVPSRVVTGYRSEEWKDGTLTIRARHAHAWAEVLDPKWGWRTVDASPALGSAAARAGSGVFARFRYWASALWGKVTHFDEGRRAQVSGWMLRLPRRLLWPAVGALLLGVGLRVRRRRRIPVDVRDYRRALRRCGASAEPGETPRQLAARVPQLVAATAAHERARYS